MRKLFCVTVDLVVNKFELLDSQIVKFVDRQMICRRTKFLDLTGTENG